MTVKEQRHGTQMIELAAFVEFCKEEGLPVMDGYRACHTALTPEQEGRWAKRLLTLDIWERS